MITGNPSIQTPIRDPDLEGENAYSWLMRLGRLRNLDSFVIPAHAAQLAKSVDEAAKLRADLFPEQT